METFLWRCQVVIDESPFLCYNSGMNCQKEIFSMEDEAKKLSCSIAPEAYM